jgi:hypothetical protein
MRGGDHGWGTTDKERTIYRYIAAAAPQSEPAQQDTKEADYG